jgi:two-component system sensor histidine kinase ChvG
VIGSTLRRFAPSRIGLRLLAFNVLVVFVPVLGVLYLDVYEAHLRQAQETAMAQEATILAAAIAEQPPEQALDPGRLARMFDRLDRRTDVRLRVYDRDRKLAGDSARSAATPPHEGSKYGPEAGDTRSRPLYRIGARIAYVTGTALDALRGWIPGGRRTPPAPPETGATAPPEVRAALAGRYGAATRATPGQRSLTMFSAVPIRRDGGVIGAIVASQSTFRILRALYDVRLHVFQIVLASLCAAAFLTALAAGTIVRPLRRLERQASRLAARRGPAPATFPGARRKDELGALARALEELTRRTNDHIALLQAFSADVSHELKNPLASIRTAAEMMAAADSPQERERFLALMTKDVARLERLVSSLRDIAVVEQQIAQEATEAVSLGDVLRDAVDRVRHSAGTSVPIELDASAPCIVRASRDRLAQVFENIVANAVSFAPSGTPVRVRAITSAATCAVTVDDRGPGIPESHLERIFTRFFSYRPAERRGDHVGLGLAISKQIVESYGGTIAASNLDGGGARFEVRLPARTAAAATSTARGPRESV